MRDRIEQLQQLPPWEWPDEASDWIRQALEDADVETRVDAAQLAPADMNDELARRLLELVRTDPEERAAAAAAIALGPALEECSVEYDDGLAEVMPGMEDEIVLSPPVYAQVRDALEAVYRDADRPVLVRRRALEAAVRAPLPWQIDATRAASQSEDLPWQQTAVFCMGFLRGFEASILEALQSDHPEVQREALLSAGRRELEQAGEQVLRVAADDRADPELRLAAIGALETLDPPGSEELLLELAEDDDDEIAEAAESALEERAVFSVLDQEQEEEP